MSRSALRYYKQKTGYRCPRRELDPSNDVPWTLTRMLLHPALTPLIAPAYELFCADMSRAGREAVLHRITNALHDGAVLSVLYPKPADVAKRKGAK